MRINKTRVALLLGVILVTGFSAYRYISIIPDNMRTGETRPSPNGQFEASVMDCYSKGFWGNQRRWFLFEVKELSSGTLLHQLETSPIEGPFFGSRSAHHVLFWSADSKTIEFRFPHTTINLNVEHGLRPLTH